jgi:hypothetical protein
MSDADTPDDDSLPVEVDDGKEEGTPAAPVPDQAVAREERAPVEELERETKAAEAPPIAGQEPVVTNRMPEPAETAREAEVRTPATSQAQNEAIQAAMQKAEAALKAAEAVKKYAEDLVKNYRN